MNITIIIEPTDPLYAFLKPSTISHITVGTRYETRIHPDCTLICISGDSMSICTVIREYTIQTRTYNPTVEEEFLKLQTLIETKRAARFEQMTRRP